MKTGNPIDGMYIFLIVIPLMVSLWGGDMLRKKIISHLVADSHWNHTVSSFVGIAVETVILAFGIMAGLLLIVVC
jgi:hypothetical protein